MSGERLAEMVDVVIAGLRTIGTFPDSPALSEDRIRAHARNIVAGLTGIEWLADAVYERNTAPMCRRCGGNAETCGHAEVLMRRTP